MRKSTLSPVVPDPRLLTRRRLLAAGAAVVAGALALTGCTSTAGPPVAGPTPGGPADPDAGLRTSVATAEAALAARYARARAAYPGLRRALAVGDRHASYVAAVLPAAPSASGSPAGPTLAATPPAASAAATLADLEAAERAAAKDRLAQCGRAGDDELARVLALVGAGCAAAAESLRQARRA